jgi:release factor glutamine methyltransferase
MTGARGPRRPPDDDVVAALRAAGCVFAEEEAALLGSAASSPADLARLVARRSGGEPLEHLLGWAAFAGLRVEVGPGVFVPRRRTELLVREAVRLLRERGLPGDGRPRVTSTPVVVDLCCGSGAVGLAVATQAGPVDLLAADVDPVAVRWAGRNVERVGGLATHGDLYDALPAGLRGRVDVLVVNAPYVPTTEIAHMPPEARDHEPGVALDGGADGLDVVRRVAAGAAGWLAPGGHLVVETSARQAPRVAEAVAAGGLPARIAVADDLDATAVVGGPAQGAPAP